MANKYQWVWLDEGCIKFKNSTYQICGEVDLYSEQETVREVIIVGQPSLEMQTLDGGFNE